MRIPPNLFGIAFGLAGLSEAWNAARPLLHVSAAAPDAIAILAAATWLILLSGYLAQGLTRILADLRDPVLSPFPSLIVIIPMIAATYLDPVAPAAARVLVVVFLVLTIALGGWLTGQWMTGERPPDTAHPGYFLPTVAGGLIGASAAAAVGLHAVAEASFGIGIVCWLLLGSLLLNRLFFRPGLAPALIPTLAIEVAPPVVGGLAYFGINGGKIDFIAAMLGGYAVLMVLVQLRFIPVYRQLSFTPGFWAFTFSYAAVAADALTWLRITRPAGGSGYAIAVLTLITAGITLLAARTVAGRRQLLPAPVQM